MGPARARTLTRVGPGSLGHGVRGGGSGRAGCVRVHARSTELQRTRRVGPAHACTQTRVGPDSLGGGVRRRNGACRKRGKACDCGAQALTSLASTVRVREGRLRVLQRAGVGGVSVLRRGGLYAAWRHCGCFRRAPPLLASRAIASSGIGLAGVERVVLAVAT